MTAIAVREALDNMMVLPPGVPGWLARGRMVAEVKQLSTNFTYQIKTNWIGCFAQLACCKCT
jgi:hypothetical protein